MHNSQKAASIPIWKITQDGMINSVLWVDATNPRFAVYDPGTPGDTSDDIVLDKETGLVWARKANEPGYQNWLNAVDYCADLALINRKGWRLPTREELSSLLDKTQSNLALPSSHPFENLASGEGAYWTASTYEGDSTQAWAISVYDGWVHVQNKINGCRVWPVRGGNGYASGNW